MAVIRQIKVFSKDEASALEAQLTSDQAFLEEVLATGFHLPCRAPAKNPYRPTCSAERSRYYFKADLMALAVNDPKFAKLLEKTFGWTTSH